ncbi:LysR family transcriptional regulator [Pseudoduganella violacea]|uniref:DNA-binding transcriptional LysR family regulator n=1 Tax=Pseudoduganella violacea TaxID=1715466 RepID=A0A7W5B679_9BURK|nr:LysR family transcriptional regulator [Pseudoduganella violacea]MBB3117313.1 DNA-binding transcriptional LysR family regulator [Pseudoduganella violacea]
MNLDPSLLRTFVAVHEAGSFTRAAERLHLTQSAISHQIRRLEEQLGRPLLQRTTRSLTITDDGEDLLPYARQILDALDSLGQRFRPSPISGEVRFGAPENFVGDRLPTLLCQFARSFPSVRLDVRVNMQLDLRALIRDGELDLAVIMTPGDSQEGTRIRQTQLVWVAGESFDLPKGSPLPLAFFPTPCINRRVGISALDEIGVKWQTVFTSPSQQGISAAILSGLAVSVLPREDVKEGMRIVDGCYGLPALPKASFALICNDEGKTAATQAFGQLILDLSKQAADAKLKRRGRR